MSFWVLHSKPCVLWDFSILDLRNVSYFQCCLGSGNYSSYSFALALSPALESLPTHTCSSVICWTLEGRFLESPLHRSLLCNTPLWKPWALWLLQTSTCISSAQRPPGSASAAPPSATSWTRFRHPTLFSLSQKSCITCSAMSENHCFIYFVWIFSCWMWEDKSIFCCFILARS